MIATLSLALGFFPAIVQVAILGFIAVLFIILIFKVVALVLDAIPFL